MALLLCLLLLAAPTPESFTELKDAYRGAVTARAWLDVEAIVPQVVASAPEGLSFVRDELAAAKERPFRRALIQGLAAVDADDALEFWEARFDAKDPFVRAVALEAYANASPALAVHPAERLIRRDEDARVRRAAAEVLAREGGVGAALTIVRAASRVGGAERRALIDLVVAMDGAVEGAVALASHPEREARLAAVRLLAKAGEGEAAAEAMRVAQHDRDLRVALVAASGLDRLKGRPSSLRARLEKRLSPDERWLLYDAICRARLVDPAAAPVLKTAALTGPADLRPKAAETYGHVARDGAVPTLVKLLEKRRPWQLSIGAARGLAATRAVAAIPPLIESLGKASGRRRAEIARALESLTGRSFGELPTHWERWWAQRGERFRVPVAPPSRWDREEKGTGFFGVEIRTEAAAFLCDVSASMVGEPLKRLQRELAGAVKRFPPGGRFNLVFFGDDVYPWAAKLQRASKTSRKRALAHIHKQRTGGATNLGDALQFVLDDPDVDTIVLLTDGLPTVGRMKHISDVRAYFEKRNRARMVELHVVCIGMRSSDLRDMAEMSGGRYLER